MCVDSCQIPIFVSNENIDLTAQAEKRDFCQLSKVKHLTWWRRTEFYTSCPTSQWMFIVEDFNMSSYSLKKRQVKVGWIDNDGNTRRIVTYKTATSPDELIAQTEVSANDRSATGLTHCSSSMCWVSCWLDIKTTEKEKPSSLLGYEHASCYPPIKETSWRMRSRDRFRYAIFWPTGWFKIVVEVMRRSSKICQARLVNLFRFFSDVNWGTVFMKLLVFGRKKIRRGLFSYII